MASRFKGNKLLTFQFGGEAVGGGKLQIFLIGLIEEVKTEEGLDGQILLVSGDPLISHPNDEPFVNQTEIDSIYLTEDQKREIYENKFICDGSVYIYTGSFSIANCQISGNLGDEERFKLLEFLGNYMSRYQIKFDTNLCQSINQGQLRQIILREDEQYTLGQGLYHGNRNKFEDDDGGCEGCDLKLRWIGKQVFVDLECPGDHPGYFVQTCLLKSIVYKSVFSSCLPWCCGEKETKAEILEQDVIHVPSSFKGKTLPIRLTVKDYRVPGWGKFEGWREWLGKHYVKCWVEAWIYRADQFNGVGISSMNIEMGAGTGLVSGGGRDGDEERAILLNGNCGCEDCRQNEGRSGNGTNPVRITIMEANLVECGLEPITETWDE